MHYLAIIIAAIFVNNFVLAKFLGLCPFIGVSKQLDGAIGMGLAVTFVMVLTSAVSYPIYWFILVPYDIAYLDTIAFILVIASLVQFVEMVMEKFAPGLYRTLGIYLPLITTNCAILGVAQLNINYSAPESATQFNFIQSVINGFGAGLGFALALILMAGIRERLEYAPIAKAMEGAPIAFIAAALMALAFSGFANIVSLAIE